MLKSILIMVKLKKLKSASFANLVSEENTQKPKDLMFQIKAIVWNSVTTVSAEGASWQSH